MISPDKLAEWIRDARSRTLALVDDLEDTQLMGPYLPTINPLLWEIGHLAWFQEKWVLRRTGAPSLRKDADVLYDSTAVAHSTRWTLPLPARADTLAYMQAVQDRVLERLAGREHAPEEQYYACLAVFHEDMHGEAFAYTRQTLAYPAPARVAPGEALHGEEAVDFPPAYVEIPGGTFRLGAAPDEPFVFDNEKWAHARDVKTFSMACCPVTQAEFADFVDANGYQRQEWWGPEGWDWRRRAGAEHPVYWRRAGRDWQRRDFDRWVNLEPKLPMLHVNWFEADAYCRWAGRRLPTEEEWEVAAAAVPAASGCGYAQAKRRFPWGQEPPSLERANLDARARGCIDVHALPAGDSAFGCRQMIGNVWEWTADPFLPYPGFVADPYKEYSAPWFGTHKVLRGGCWATRGRLLRNTWRNFYRPDRRDVWAGFRTCWRPP